MSTEVTLPALGESVTEGTVSRWLKQVGDTIEIDEPLVEVSTDKVDTEIPSPVAGTILEIRVQEDDTAPVGAVLAVIGEAGEGDGDKAELAAPEAEAEPPAEEAPAAEPAAQDAPEEVAEPSQPSTEKDEPAQAPAAASSGSGTEVTLPALGESVTEGTVSRWLKAVGETVEVDEPLVEVSTDKVDTELPSAVAGTVLEIRVQEDETAPVGAVLALIGEAGDAAAEQPAEQTPAPEANEPAQQQAEKPVEVDDPKADKAVEVAESQDEGSENLGDNAEVHESPVESAAENVDDVPEAPKEPSNVNQVAPRRASESSDGYVTPLVRKLASQHGVELSEITGTGVGGRVRKQDVLEAAEAKKKAAEEAAKAAETAKASAAAPSSGAPSSSAPAAKTAAVDDSGKRGTTEKITRLRATIAKRMVESLQVSAQLTATVEVDVTAISRLRAQHKDEFKKRNGASLSYLPFITKAAVEALKQFPKVNATIDTEAGTITYADAEHIGIAVDTEKGLLVPVIKDAGDLNITGLAKKIADLASRTRSNKVTPDELGGGTFTITNYGSAGTLFDTPIINQPQVAILGTGALVKRPVVVEDQFGGETIAVRHMMYLSMSYDHRLVDGADAARFLQSVKERLETGDFAGDF